MGKLNDAQRELASNTYYLVEKHMRFRNLKETDIEDYHGILCESLIRSIINYKSNDVCSIETYIINGFDFDNCKILSIKDEKINNLLQTYEMLHKYKKDTIEKVNIVF